MRKIKNQKSVGTGRDLSVIIKNSKILILILVLISHFSFISFAQDNLVEINLDVNSDTSALPKIFKPNMDLSGRGLHYEKEWPQSVAAKEVLDIWQKEIGFSGIYRLQYNFWEINENAKDNDKQKKLLENYESIFKRVTDAGGIIILDLFGTPAGLGKVLDKKSPPLDFRAYKEFVKSYIRELSCNKRYNIWYEVWSAPDLDDFFLGRKQEYLAMYRAIAEGVRELELETKVNIPLGGPSTSWWFQNPDGNSIVTPERSLIYDLIKYCYRYHLPLDFISWHAYSTDPKAEQEVTRYSKTPAALIREWLSYFSFDKDMPLIISEWNYDSGANILPARQEKANICASFIPARINNMFEAGLDYQVYFCLEDFQNNKERVVRNVGVFLFDKQSQAYKGGVKSIFNVLEMLAGLGKNRFILPKINDEFIGGIASKGNDTITVLIYNYIDPYLSRNYLSRNIALLNDSERKMLLNFIRSDELEKIIYHKLDISSLQTTNKVKAMLKKAQELNDNANIFMSSVREVKLNIKNLEGNYSYSKYIVDSSCSLDCAFSPVESKQIDCLGPYKETLIMPAYSVQMIILKKEPKGKVVVSDPSNIESKPEVTGKKAE
ncbi:MAG: hypothetical protein ABIH18_06115 [Candidatus Omnitrophota bacterium]